MDILSEPMLYHGVAQSDTVQARMDELLEQVGLPREMKHRYPHEFSGGQRAAHLHCAGIVPTAQGHCPGRACERPGCVGAGSQILNLLRDLQEQMHLTYLFIGHGLGAVRYISHRIGVMYMGRLVESGDAEELFAHPAHPYTRALLDAVPVADYALRNRPRITLAGEVGELPASGNGCPFAPPLSHGDGILPGARAGAETPGRRAGTDRGRLRAGEQR